MKIMAIHPDQVPAAWPVLSRGIDRVLKQGLQLYDADQVRENVADGSWLLFAAFDDGEPLATIVAQIREGKQRIFEVGMCWGKEVETWIADFEQAFTKIGQQCGCHALAFNGRPGWRKLARIHDFSINSVTYLKVIDDG